MKEVKTKKTQRRGQRKRAPSLHERLHSAHCALEKRDIVTLSHNEKQQFQNETSTKINYCYTTQCTISHTSLVTSTIGDCRFLSSVSCCLQSRVTTHHTVHFFSLSLAFFYTHAQCMFKLINLLYAFVVAVTHKHRFCSCSDFCSS